LAAWKKHPLTITAVAVAVLAALAAYFFDAMLVALLCVLLALWQIIRALYHAVSHNVGALKWDGVRFVVWVAACVGATNVHDRYITLTKERGESIVAALKTYHAREGGYPKTLDALAPRDMAAVPTVALVPASGTKFNYRSDGAKFTLAYSPGFLMMTEYDSTTARWDTRD
jgi:hypothetical protein